MRYPPKGTIKSVRKIVSDRGYDLYLIDVESTIDLLILDHYGGGVCITAVDSMTGDGVYSKCFRNIRELRRYVKHDDKYYYFPLMELSRPEIYVFKNQLEELLKKIDPYFFK